MSDKPKQPEMKLAYEESCSCCMKNEDAISTFILELSLYNKHRMYVDDHIARVQELEAELQEALLDDKERVNAWKARVQELEEALDQCIAYIKTGNHKTLDMEFILSIAKLREGGDG